VEIQGSFVFTTVWVVLLSVPMAGFVSHATQMREACLTYV